MVSSREIAFFAKRAATSSSASRSTSWSFNEDDDDEAGDAGTKDVNED
jgi:hypothetical protein